MGENIGAVARAMMNTGLDELRLVEPRDGWPNPAATAMAAGADRILEAATVFSSLDDAIADCHWVAATTARLRDMVKPVLSPRELAGTLNTYSQAGQRTAILFGRERSGLTNDETARANAILTIPLSPEHPSLNLAQAVLLAGYEWFQLAGTDRHADVTNAGSVPDVADRREVEQLTANLIARLDASGFLSLPDKRPRMIRNLRNIFERHDLTQQEVNTLHGVFKSLATRRAD